MEKAWYELSPFVYIVFAAVILVHANHIAAFFASLLLLAALLIGLMRLQFRTSPVKAKKAKVVKHRPF